MNLWDLGQLDGERDIIRQNKVVRMRSLCRELCPYHNLVFFIRLRMKQLLQIFHRRYFFVYLLFEVEAFANIFQEILVGAMVLAWSRSRAERAAEDHRRRK